MHNLRKNSILHQRLKNCSNSTNFDTIKCDSYSTRLMHREKPTASKFRREGSCGSANTSSAKFSAVAIVPPAPAKSKMSQRLPKQQAPADKHSTVEVHKRTPWTKLLQQPSTDFEQFDPLRTIHFLAMELQSKLKNDPQMTNMLVTMQDALDRIPPDISASGVPLQRSKSESRSSVNRIFVNKAEEKPKSVSSKGCQTQNSVTCTDSEIFQKKLESSTAKLEASCQQMEILCDQLKNEKQYLEEVLQTEKNKVQHLKQQLEKKDFPNANFDKVLQERNEFENKLKAQASSYHGPTIQDLKTRMQELQTQKMVVEQENISLRHKVASFDMEREKYATLLNIRDRHINEIMNEVNSLQEVVGEQFVQLQKLPLTSSPSSASTLLGIKENYSNLPWSELGLLKIKEAKEDAGSDNEQNQFCLSMHPLYARALKELKSSESSLSNMALVIPKAPFFSKENGTKEGDEDDSSKKTSLTNLRELFNEVKQQALDLRLPQFS